MENYMTKHDRALPSHVYKSGNRYCVSQTINKKRRYYGYFKNLKEAIHLRNQLVQQGVIHDKRGHHRIKNYNNRYIYPSNGKYRITKVVNKQQESFGMYTTLQEAREERDYLESIDWDYSNMY